MSGVEFTPIQGNVLRDHLRFLQQRRRHDQHACRRACEIQVGKVFSCLSVLAVLTVLAFTTN